LRVLVVHRGGERGEHGRRRVVLRRDQPERRAFAVQLVRDGPRHLRIGRLQLFPTGRVLARHSSPLSMAAICSRRGTCRPPSNGVASQSSTISRASVGAMTRAPIESTVASLCWRESRAVYRSLQSAARAPSTLFAAICSP